MQNVNAYEQKCSHEQLQIQKNMIFYRLTHGGYSTMISDGNAGA